MKTNPLLEELWRVKEDLAREAGYDIGRTLAELRAAEARQPGPLIGSPDELRRFAKDLEGQREPTPAAGLKEEPPLAPTGDATESRTPL